MWNQHNPQNKSILLLNICMYHICYPQQDVAIALKSMSRVSTFAGVVDGFSARHYTRLQQVEPESPPQEAHSLLYVSPLFALIRSAICLRSLSSCLPTDTPC